MDELMAFVHARLDDEQARAEAASWAPDASRWTAHHREKYDDRWVIVDSLDDRVTEVSAEASDDAGVAGHIAHQDPARTLRDVQSRCKTLLRCQEEMLSGIPRLVHFARMTVWEMAQRWNDHEAFKEEWKP